MKLNKIYRTKENNLSTSYLVSYNNNSNLNIRSEENKNKLGKEKLNINNRKNNSIKRFYNINNNKVIKGNSLNKKLSEENIPYIFTNSNTNKSMITNNLISSYNRESSKDFSSDLYNKFRFNKKEDKILTDINDKNKRIIKQKYSLRDINKRVFIRNENNKLIMNKYGIKRGRSTRQKNSLSEMEILI